MVDFLVIGPINIVSYKDIFPLIKDGMISLGYNKIPKFIGGFDIGNITWFSTFEVKKDGLILSKSIEDGYDRYDHYDAVNVNRLEDIPGDYDGLMGVPISFLEYWNKDQFEVVQMMADWMTSDFLGLRHQKIDGKRVYARVMIRRKKDG